MDTYYTDDGCQYIGMSQDTIVALRTDLGKSTAFISEDDAMALRDVPQLIAQSLSGATSTAKTADQRLDDLIATLTGKGIL